MPHFSPLPRAFSLQLESLRGLSAIIVLFSHCFQAVIAPLDQSIYPIIRLLGQAAVMMFFVLSGYLIGYSIQKNITRYQQFNLRQYIQQRCKRILLPFIFALILTVILYFIAPYFFASATQQILPQQPFMIRYAFDINLIELLGTALFLNGFLTSTLSSNAALWSLSYEVWFYVLAGCLMLFRNRIAVLIFMITLGLLSFLNLQFLLYFMVWLSAFAFSFLQSSTYILPLQLQAIKIFFAMLALLIAIFDFYQFHFLDQGKNYSAENFTYFNLCIGMAFCCWLVQLRFKLRHFTPIWVHSARFSYTLYVTHFPLILFSLGCFPFLLTSGLVFALFGTFVLMLICILFAYKVAQYLEPQSHPIS